MVSEVREISRLALLVAFAVGCSSSNEKAPPLGSEEPASDVRPSVESSSHKPRPIVHARQLLSAEALAELVGRPPPAQWFGVALAGRKIGWASLAIETRATEVVVASAMSVSREGSEPSLELTEERAYDIAAPHRLKSVTSIEESADGRTEITVKRRGSGMERRVVVNGSVAEAGGLARSAETLADAVIQSFAKPAWLAQGERAVIVELDVDHAGKGGTNATNVDRETTIVVKDKTTRRVAGVDSPVVTLELVRVGQAPTTTTLAGDGLLLEATVGAFSFEAADERSAKRDIAGLGLSRAAVAVGSPLGDVGAATHIEVKLSMDSALAASSPIPETANQHVRRDGDDFVVRIERRPGARVTATERRENLRATVAIDSSSAPIKKLALSLTEPTTTRRAAVAALNDWVFANLEKRLATDLSTATSVLSKRAGDCTEHSLLFVALARAAGIAAREVSGLIYLGDQAQSFGWHAWAEAEIDGRWWRVDPSWGELPANPSHLTLGIADDNRWIALIGGLKIETLRR